MSRHDAVVIGRCGTSYRFGRLPPVGPRALALRIAIAQVQEGRGTLLGLSENINRLTPLSPTLEASQRNTLHMPAATGSAASPEGTSPPPHSHAVAA